MKSKDLPYRGPDNHCYNIIQEHSEYQADLSKNKEVFSLPGIKLLFLSHPACSLETYTHYVIMAPYTNF